MLIFNKDFKKISVNQINLYIMIFYLETKQCEFDKFSYIKNSSSDNGRLYKYLLELYYNHNNPKMLNR